MMVSVPVKLTVLSNRVFVVHGSDNEMKIAVARTLEQLKLKPVILHEKPNEGRTLLHKFNDHSDVLFAVVLLSPDERGCLARSGAKARPRASQEVIFKHGFFWESSAQSESLLCTVPRGILKSPLTWKV